MAYGDQLPNCSNLTGEKTQEGLFQAGWGQSNIPQEPCLFAPLSWNQNWFAGGQAAACWGMAGLGERWLLRLLSLVAVIADSLCKFPESRPFPGQARYSSGVATFFIG